MVDEKELDIIEKAHLAAERLERANKMQEALLAKQEELQKRAEGLRLLGGESQAGGQPTRELTKEEKDREATKRIFKGSAIEPYLK